MYIQQTPNYKKQRDPSGMNGLNTIKDMLAGLPQFEEMKGAYSLHLGMAQECMDLFQRQKLPDMASVEQVCIAWSDKLLFSDSSSRFWPLALTKIIESQNM
jgi:syntaxin-binding protein 1